MKAGRAHVVVDEEKAAAGEERGWRKGEQALRSSKTPACAPRQAQQQSRSDLMRVICCDLSDGDQKAGGEKRPQLALDYVAHGDCAGWLVCLDR